MSWRLAVVSACLSIGCSAGRLPDPGSTARSYAAAVERKDAAALHALLTPGGQVDYSAADVARLLSENNQEILRAARTVAVRGAVCRQDFAAVTQLATGEGIESVRRGGRFELRTAAFIPGRPTDPIGALREFRAALVARDLSRLLVLSADVRREENEKMLSELESALEDPRTFQEDEVLGGVIVRLGNGSRVTLVREGEVYRILEVQ